MFKSLIEAAKRILGIRTPEPLPSISPVRDFEMPFHPNCHSVYLTPPGGGNVTLRIGLGRLRFAIDLGDGHLIPLAGIKSPRFKGLPILYHGRRVGKVLGVKMGRREIEMRCRIARGVPFLMGSSVEIEP